MQDKLTSDNSLITSQAAEIMQNMEKSRVWWHASRFLMSALPSRWGRTAERRSASEPKYRYDPQVSTSPAFAGPR